MLKGPDEFRHLAAPSGNLNIQKLADKIQEWAQFDIEATFEDAERQARLVVWLHAETGCPKSIARLCIKLIAPILSKGIKLGTNWSSRAATHALLVALLKIPGVEKFIDSFERLVGKFSGTVKAQIELDDLIADLSPAAGDLKLHMESDLRASYALLEAFKGQFESQEQIASLLGNLASPQPVLMTALDTSQLETRFVYRARKIPFSGRDQEMTLLKTFLDVDLYFTWLLVHGSGGIGKSRLALEFMLAHGGAYQAGFLSNIEASRFDWSRWRPNRPTLIIIDYASTHPDSVAVVMESLAQRTNLDWPVRLLLLDRTDKGGWLETIRRVGHTAQAVVHQACHPIHPIHPIADQLPSESTGYPLGPVEDIWPLMIAQFDKANYPVPDRRETLEILSDIDEARRPLYAAFLADAIIRGESPRAWDRQRLVEDVLAYERNHYWRNPDFTLRHEMLVALATMTDGMDMEQLETVCKSDNKKVFPCWSPLELPQALQGVYGLIPHTRIPPIEPDILGEAFVLELLIDKQPALIAELRNQAWSYDPHKYTGFLNRLDNDFSSKNLRILYSSDDSMLKNKHCRYERAELSVRLIAGLCDLETCGLLYEELSTLAKAHSNEPKLRLALAQATVNFMNKHELNNTNNITSHMLYNDLINLAESHSNEPQLRIAQATGAFNLINSYGDQAMDVSLSLYDDLKTLATQYRNEPDLRLLQAKAAYDLITIIRYRDLKLSRYLYSEMKTLVSSYNTEPKLRIELAKAAFNCIVFLGTHDFQESNTLYAELKALSETYDQEPDLRSRQAKAAAHLIMYLGQRDVEMSRRLYTELEDLASEYCAEPQLNQILSELGMLRKIFEMYPPDCSTLII